MSKAYLIVVIVTAHFLRAYTEDFRVVYEWFKIDFAWPDDRTKSEAYLQGKYIPENNVIQNIRIWRDRAFLTLPRSKSGVPVTLATVSIEPRGGSASPRLDPFPSWLFQTIGECRYFQNVRGIEIDTDGFIWIVDAGSNDEIITDQKCKPKIFIFDIENRKLIKTNDFFNIPEEATLGDIVLDPRNIKTAYISVSTKTESFILVYKNELTYKITGLPKSNGKKITVNGTNVFLRNKLSLALSLTENKLYMSFSSSYNLYSVPLGLKDVSENLTNLGNKTGISTGLIVDSKNNLYFGLIEKDSIVKWNLKNRSSTELEIFPDSFLQWPDSFSFDDSGHIWVVTNRYQTYLDGSVNVGVPNFRLIQAFTGSKSYLYGNYTNLDTTNGASRIMFCVCVFFEVTLLQWIV